MHWIGAAFLAIVAVLMLLQRRALARAQAMVLGGSVLPGCVVVEAVVVLILAMAVYLTR